MPIDTEQQREMVALYAKGHSIRQTGILSLVSYEVARQALIAAGTKLRPRGGPRLQQDHRLTYVVGRLYEAGSSISEIAETVGLHEVTVRKHLRRTELPRR